MIQTFLISLLLINPIVQNDTSYVRFDPFVEDTCKVVFHFEPRRISVDYQGTKEAKTCLTKYRVISQDRDTTYLYNDNFGSDFDEDIVFGYYTMNLKRLNRRLKNGICDMTHNDVLDHYIYGTYKEDAMIYYNQHSKREQKADPFSVSFTLIPRKASLKTRERLNALSDALTNEDFIKKNGIHQLSSKYAAKCRKRMIDYLDYRFDSAESIYILETCDDGRLYWASIYSPDKNVSQPWYILEKSGNMVHSFMYKDYSCQKIKEIIFSDKKSRLRIEPGGLDNFLRILLFTKNSQGEFDINYYEKTEKKMDMFIPQQKQVINL